MNFTKKKKHYCRAPSVAPDMLNFHEKHAGTKQCNGFQRGPQTGNYLSHSNAGGSGGNGDEWRARGQGEEAEWRLLFGNPLCKLLKRRTETHTDLKRKGKNNDIPRTPLPYGSLRQIKTVALNICGQTWAHINSRVPVQ